MEIAATRLEQINTSKRSTNQDSSNPLANLWLSLLTACLGGTLLCTAALVAWPLIATRFIS